MVIRVSTQRGAMLRAVAPGRWFEKTEGIVFESVREEIQYDEMQHGIMWRGRWVEKARLLGVLQ